MSMCAQIAKNPCRFSRSLGHNLNGEGRLQVVPQSFSSGPTACVLELSNVSVHPEVIRCSASPK